MPAGEQGVREAMETDAGEPRETRVSGGKTCGEANPVVMEPVPHYPPCYSPGQSLGSRIGW